MVYLCLLIPQQLSHPNCFILCKVIYESAITYCSSFIVLLLYAKSSVAYIDHFIFNTSDM